MAVLEDEINKEVILEVHNGNIDISALFKLVDDKIKDTVKDGKTGR